MENYVYPGLEITGVGRIGLPLPESQAKEIIAKCCLAPYGKVCCYEYLRLTRPQGEATIYDTQVRNTWQLDPSKITFSNPAWGDTINKLVAKVHTELGIGENVKISVQLYKLLLYLCRTSNQLSLMNSIYEKGGLFLPHRDTEKQDGMFGTLVVILPCEFEGMAYYARYLVQTLIRSQEES